MVPSPQQWMAGPVLPGMTTLTGVLQDIITAGTQTEIPNRGASLNHGVGSTVMFLLVVSVLQCCNNDYLSCSLFMLLRPAGTAFK